MEAKVIAWGPFKRNIADYLDYPESDYLGVKTGTIVFSHFFYCNSKRQSEELAEFLVIDSADFNQYHFNNYQARQLVEFIDANDPAILYLEQYLPSASEEWNALRQLILAGFEFYFDPGYY